MQVIAAVSDHLEKNDSAYYQVGSGDFVKIKTKKK